MQDAHLAEPQQSLRPKRPEHQQRQQDQKFEGENFDHFVGKLDGGTESHGETRRERLHLQLRSKPHNGKRVGAHGSPHLWNGGDFSWKEFQKIDGVCRQDTHSQYTSVQYSWWPSSCHRMVGTQRWITYTSCLIFRLVSDYIKYFGPARN